MPAKEGSVLAMMAKSITDKKGAASAGLTPIAGEAQRGPRIPDVPEVFLTNEAVIDVSLELRRLVGMLLDVATGLDRLTGKSSEAVVKVDTKAAKKEAEKAADEAAAEREAIQFTERFEQLQAEAQAATFVGTETLDESGQETLDSGWTCPDHGKAVEKTSPKGRKYQGCPECRNFELPS